MDVTEVRTRSKVVDLISGRLGLKISRPLGVGRVDSPKNRSLNSIVAISDKAYKQITDGQYLEALGCFEQEGWQLSRERPTVIPTSCDRYYLEQIDHLSINRAYHATPVSNMASIKRAGLLPGKESTGNTDRRDTLGKLYVTLRLGSVGDCVKKVYGTAHWWKDHFACDNRFHDPEWCVLELELSGIPGLLCYEDSWSVSGIVVRAPDGIDPARIRRVA